MVDLEQEEDVVLIDFVVVALDKCNNLLLEITLLIWSPNTAAPNLPTIKHIFDVSVMQVDVCQLLDFVAEFVAEFFDDVFEDLLDEIKVIDENLQEVLNLNLLVRFEAELCEITLELFLVFGVVDESLGNLFDDSQNSLALILSI